ncbi:MAG TPA: hypothetical protein VFZ59_13255 [Verrucomicrobiae bacterium]|nr:hypothetical protein [Verrucomicrobiae bacterium]
MKHDQSTTHMEFSYSKRISWPAIFAGITTAIIIQLLLLLLGVGIGAASANPLQERNPGEGLAIGGLIWFFGSSIIAMYVGGRVAGRLSNGLTKKDRMQHGILTWAATTILSAIFLTTVMSSLLGGAAGTAAAGSAIQAKSTQLESPGAVSVTEPEARQATAVAAKRVSQTALATFFLLLLSGVAAAVGGGNSAPQSRYDEDDEHESHSHVAPAFIK